MNSDLPDSAAGHQPDIAALLARLDRQGMPWTVDTLRLIEKYPGVNTAALARRTGERPAEINSRLRRLADAGVIERGDGLGHRLSALGVAMLQSAG